jgi:hypothetical protein
MAESPPNSSPGIVLSPIVGTCKLSLIIQILKPPLWSSGQSSGYRSRGRGSILGATIFSEK